MKPKKKKTKTVVRSPKDARSLDRAAKRSYAKHLVEELTKRMFNHSVVCETALVIVTARELEELLEAYKKMHRVK